MLNFFNSFNDTANSSDDSSEKNNSRTCKSTRELTAEEKREQYEKEFWETYKNLVIEPCKSSTENYFVCGDLNVLSAETINAHNIVVIGDLNAADLSGVGKVVHISPNRQDEVLLKILGVESRRGSWKIIDDILYKDNVRTTRGADYCMLLLRTFSKCLSMKEMTKMTDEEFYLALKRMVRAMSGNESTNKADEKSE